MCCGVRTVIFACSIPILNCSCVRDDRRSRHDDRDRDRGRDRDSRREERPREERPRDDRRGPGGEDKG